MEDDLQPLPQLVVGTPHNVHLFDPRRHVSKRKTGKQSRIRCLSPGGKADLHIRGRTLELGDPDYDPRDCYGDSNLMFLGHVDRYPVAFSTCGRYVFQQFGDGPSRVTHVHDLGYLHNPPNRALPTRPDEIVLLPDWLEEQGCDLFGAAGLDPPQREFQFANPLVLETRSLSQEQRLSLLESHLSSEPTMDGYHQIVLMFHLWPDKDVGAGLAMACAALADWPQEALILPKDCLADAPEAVWDLVFGISSRVQLDGQRLTTKHVRKIARRPDISELQSLSVTDWYSDWDAFKLFVSNIPFDALTELNLDSSLLSMRSLGALARSENFHRLERLTVSASDISGKRHRGVCKIGRLSSLKELSLHWNSLEERDVEKLASWGIFDSLIALDLSVNRVMDSPARALSKASCRLQALDLRSTGLTDDSIKLLAQSPSAHSLRRLLIGSSHITDEAVRVIVKSMPQLEELDLYKSDVTSAGRGMLAKAMPNCVVY